MAKVTVFYKEDLPPVRKPIEQILIYLTEQEFRNLKLYLAIANRLFINENSNRPNELLDLIQTFKGVDIG